MKANISTPHRRTRPTESPRYAGFLTTKRLLILCVLLPFLLSACSSSKRFIFFEEDPNPWPPVLEAKPGDTILLDARLVKKNPVYLCFDRNNVFVDHPNDSSLVLMPGQLQSHTLTRLVDVPDKAISFQVGFQPGCPTFKDVPGVPCIVFE